MRNNKKNGFIQVLPLILLAAFAVTTLVIANRVQTQEQEIRSQAAGGTCVGTPPANCKVSGFTISGCAGREESNCKAVSRCGCSWSLSTTTTTTTTTCSGIRPTCATGYTLKCKAPNYICERTAPLPSGTAPKPVITSVAPKPVTTEAPKPVATAPVTTPTQYYRLNTTTRTCDKVAFSSTALTLAECNKRLAALPVSPVTTSVKIKPGVKCTNASGCLCDIPNTMLFVSNGQTCPAPTATPATTTQPTTRYYYDLTQKKCVEDKNGVSLAECKAEAATYYYAEVYNNCLKSAPKSACDADVKTFRFNTSDPNNPKCEPYVYGALSKEECQKKLTDYQHKTNTETFVVELDSATRRYRCVASGGLSGAKPFDQCQASADAANGNLAAGQAAERLPDNALCFPTGGISRCTQCSSGNKYLASDGVRCAPQGLSSPACNTAGKGNCIPGQAYRCIANIGGSWELRRDDSCTAAGAAGQTRGPASCTFKDTTLVEQGRVVCRNVEYDANGNVKPYDASKLTPYDCCNTCKNGLNSSGTFPKCSERFRFDETAIQCVPDANGALSRDDCVRRQNAAVAQKGAAIVQPIVDRTRQCIFDQCGTYTICLKALAPCLGFKPAPTPTTAQIRCPDSTRLEVIKAGAGTRCAFGGEYDCCSFCPSGTKAGTGENEGLCMPVATSEGNPARDACRGKNPGDCSGNGKLCSIFHGIVYETQQKCLGGAGIATGTDIISEGCCENNGNCPTAFQCTKSNGTCASGKSCEPRSTVTECNASNLGRCNAQGQYCMSGGAPNYQFSTETPHPKCVPQAVQPHCPDSRKDQTNACNPSCCGTTTQCPAGEQCTATNGFCKSGLSCQTRPTATECNEAALGKCNANVTGQMCKLTGISGAVTYGFSADSRCAGQVTVQQPSKSETFVLVFNQDSKTYACEASAISGAASLDVCQKAMAKENAKIIAAKAAPAVQTFVGQASQQVVATFCKLFPNLTACKALSGPQVPEGVPVVQPTPVEVVPPSTGGGTGGGPPSGGSTGGGGAPSATCRYGSTQARVQKDITDPWKPTLTADCGNASFANFNVGSFHNETGQFANDTRMVVTGPNKFSKLFTNGAAVTATISGTYILTVTTPGQSGGGCTQQASATVINCPTPTPTPTPSSGRCSTSPIRYPVEGVGWCDATGVRCRYINGKVTQLPDPWCDLEGVPASTCTGPDQRTNTSVQCTRPAGTSCGDATCQAPVENWETCASDCPLIP